jgi:FkbM family methyltransferase
MMRALAKPWFLWRPAQLIARARVALSPPSPGFADLAIAWGGTLRADPTKTIGRSIATTGIYDLAVSELLIRLVSPRDLVIDAGANVGYMSVLLGHLVGPTGRVLAWEPHPDLFAVLERNVARFPDARVEPRRAALGDAKGTADLVIPAHMASNDGVSYIGASAVGARTLPVAVERLDDRLGGAAVSLLKMDVEGFEASVLRGATEAVADRRIRHVVFEDHVGRGSAVMAMLEGLGYTIFSVGWAMTGPMLRRGIDVSVASGYEAPNFLATLAPAEVESRCAGRGWRALRRLETSPTEP